MLLLLLTILEIKSPIAGFSDEFTLTDKIKK